MCLFHVCGIDKTTQEPYILEMLQRKLNSIRKNSHKMFLLSILSIVIFSQLVSVHHQVQHVTDYNDIACVQCVNTPDQVDSFPVLSFVYTKLETPLIQSTLSFNYIDESFHQYSARAPPTIV